MLCPHCLKEISDNYVEPLYTLQQAAELVPLTLPALKQYLSRHKDDYPAIYRYFRDVYPTYRATRRIRLLPASQVRLLRSQYLRGPGMHISDTK